MQGLGTEYVMSQKQRACKASRNQSGVGRHVVCLADASHHGRFSGCQVNRPFALGETAYEQRHEDSIRSWKACRF